MDALAADPLWQQQFQPELWITSAEPATNRAYQRRQLPHWLARIVHRFAGEPKWLRQRVVDRYLDDLRDGDVAWLFPSLDASVYQGIRQRGGHIVQEMVNTALPAHRAALVRAHEALGWQPTWLPSAAEIADEAARVQSANALFSCSPWTTQSLLAIGARPDQLLPCSYGWDPASFQPVPRRSEQPRFLFVANGIVRKGLPHLLRAWEAAAPNGVLVLVGNLAPEVAERCARQLARPDVEHHPFSNDLARHYGHADAFVLPSFEEGSPLVTYLALAAGLPCLLSPEAAGWVVRDGEEGLLAPAGDHAAWVELLRRTAEDRPLLEQLGARGRLRSQLYTWSQVMQRRCAALHSHLSGTPNEHAGLPMSQTRPVGIH